RGWLRSWNRASGRRSSRRKARLANGQVENPLTPNGTQQGLQPDSDLLRMLAKKVWLEAGNLSEAFFLRSTDIGLSVCFGCTPAQCAIVSELNRSYGAASLKVQAVTDLGLTVQPDAKANHAEIHGLPNKEVDGARAEFLASQLAKAATIVD